MCAWPRLCAVNTAKQSRLTAKGQQYCMVEDLVGKVKLTNVGTKYNAVEFGDLSQVIANHSHIQTLSFKEKFCDVVRVTVALLGQNQFVYASVWLLVECLHC